MHVKMICVRVRAIGRLRVYADILYLPPEECFSTHRKHPPEDHSQL